MSPETSLSVILDVAEKFESLEPLQVEQLAKDALKILEDANVDANPIREVILPLISTIGLLLDQLAHNNRAQLRFLTQIMELDTETASVGQVKSMAMIEGISILL